MFREIVLVLILSFILIGCSKQKDSDKINQYHWKALSYLPYNTSYLMYLNLDELRKRNYDDSYLHGSVSLAGNESWLNDLESKTGVGFKNGISQIIIGSAWNNNTAVAFIPNGREKLSAYFNDNLTFSKKVDKVYTLKKNPITSFYFPDDSTLVILNNDDYADKLLSNNSKSLKENKGLINLLEEISIKNSYWIIANDPIYVKYLIAKLIGHHSDDAKSLLKNITALTMAATIGEEPSIETNLKCIGKKDALALSTAIRTALIMDLFSGANYELNKILKKTEVEREGTFVNLSLNLNKQDINQLKEITKKFSGNK